MITVMTSDVFSLVTLFCIHDPLIYPYIIIRYSSRMMSPSSFKKGAPSPQLVDDVYVVSSWAPDRTHKRCDPCPGSLWPPHCVAREHMLSLG